MVWAERCTPPLGGREVDTIANSISRRATAERFLPSISAEELKADTEAKSSSQPVGQILGEIGQQIHVPTQFVSTPFQTLNDLLYGGMIREEYLILGGRPGVGKTAFVLQYARHAARVGIRTLVVTLEMSPRQLASRLAVIGSGVSAGDIRRGGLSGEELDRFQRAVLEMQQLPIVIEAGLRSAEQMYSLVEQARDSGEPYGLMILDYLQCLRPLVPNPKGERRLEIDVSSSVLKSIPRRLGCPMIAVSSLSRNIGEPSMQELKESGNLEYDADIVLLLHGEKFDRRVKATVAKARDAQIGVFDLYYDGTTYTFSESAPGQPAGTRTEYKEPF